MWNFNDEAGFSQVLHLDTPKSVVPGSEAGELTVSGGLALPMVPRSGQKGGLSDALSAITTFLSAHHLGRKINESVRGELFRRLPGHVSKPEI